MDIYNTRSKEKAERLVKLRDYLYANASPTRAVKMADILTHLENKGHDVTIKTVYSDLKTLEIHFGLNIQYDGKERGYLLLNPPFEPYELRSIVNSIQAAKFLTQQEADRLTEKIIGLADEDTKLSLKRRTYVPNRVRSINEEAMRGLDTIYEAIANDQKIKYKYFHHSADRNCPKRYVLIDGSSIIKTSPYEVSWNGDSFQIFTVRKSKEIYKKYVLQLSHMEQIEIIPDKREGKAVAEKGLSGFGNKGHTSSFYIRTKFLADNIWISDFIDKFGENVVITPLPNGYFTASIDEPLTPELYLWTTKFFSPRIEIIFPEDAESKLRQYFADISEGKQTIQPFF